MTQIMISKKSKFNRRTRKLSKFLNLDIKIRLRIALKNEKKIVLNGD